MALYVGKDLTFEVPEDWEDRSVVAYGAPTSRANPNAPNIVVTRDRLEDGEDPAKYANRTVVQLAKQLQGFRLQEQKDAVLGGLPARELLFSWLGARGRIVQRLAMVFQERRVFNVTTTVATSDAAKVTPVFDRILSTVRFGPADARPPAAPRPPPLPPSQARSSATPPPMPPASAPPSGISTPPSGTVPAIIPNTWALGPESQPPARSPGSSQSMRAASAEPPPLDRAPRSRGGTHQMGARAIADATGKARGAAAALWQKPAEGLVARDLYQYMPWACRHEVVYVTDNAELGVVVATGASAPIVFADPARVTELNLFLRAENVALPRGVPADDLAQTIRTLLLGPEGYVGSAGFYQRERHRFEVWVMNDRSEKAAQAFSAHCEGAVLNVKGDAWVLLFSCFSRTRGIERWEITGEGNRVRTATFIDAMAKPPAGT